MKAQRQSSRWTADKVKTVAVVSFAIVAFITLLDPFALLYPLQLRTVENLEPLSLYKTNWAPREDAINVHLIPHTHDDAGWQVSVDEYQLSQVDVILDNVFVQLEQNPDRRFTYAETNFFAAWYRRQSLAVQLRVRKLIDQGRLEFVNGGWAQHDEAGPLFTEMIDQTTRGHLWLKKHLGICPNVGWQLDPFGHSQTQAWLLSSKVGLNSMFFGRSDYRELAMRYANSSLEYLWESSKSQGASTRIFAGQLFGQGRYGGYYSWYPFEETNAGDRNYVQDDPSMQDYNVAEWVEKIVQAAKHQASQTKTNHQLWMLGNDFTYQAASRWYTNYDKLIHYVNLDGRVRIFYSTPGNYVKAKFSAFKSTSWETRTADMFPLADGPHEYWTGYFTSRVSLKRQYRYASSFLRSVRQLETLMRFQFPKSKISPKNDSSPRMPTSPLGRGWSDDLEGALAVVAHHDGITGTARQSVTNDYANRLALGASRSEFGFGQALETLANISPGGAFGFCNCNSAGPGDCLNMSSCSFTTSRQAFTIVVWNPSVQHRHRPIRIPVVGTHHHVISEDGQAITEAALVELEPLTKGLPLLYLNDYGMTPAQVWEASLALENPATHELVIPVTVAPLGYSVYRVTSGAVQADPRDAAGMAEEILGFGIENEMYKIELDPLTKRIVAVMHKLLRRRFPLDIEWGYYHSSVGGCSKEKPDPDACYSQASGAYLFRPNGTDLAWKSVKPIRTRIRRVGSMGFEIFQQFNEFISHTVSLLPGTGESIHVDWTVGPIPVDDNLGKEVVVRYRLGRFKSEKRFQTDSNGREMVDRVRDKRSSDFCSGKECLSSLKYEPISSNYYPVNSIISIDDGKHELDVIVDATQGGTSLNDGELELMVHRRVLVDDYRGVEEPLNETMCGCGDINAHPGKMGAHGHLGDGGCGCPGLAIKGRHLLVLHEVEEAKRLRRKLASHMVNPLQLAFFENEVRPDKRRERFNASSVLKPGFVFPENVDLITFCSNYENGTLVRFAHQFEVNEHSLMSEPAKLSLKNVFRFKIKSVSEYSLSANQPISKIIDAQKGLPWVKVGQPQNRPDALEFISRSLVSTSDDDFVVNIAPMDVVTFWIQFEEEKQQ